MIPVDRRGKGVQKERALPENDGHQRRGLDRNCSAWLWNPIPSPSCTPRELGSPVPLVIMALGTEGPVTMLPRDTEGAGVPQP